MHWGRASKAKKIVQRFVDALQARDLTAIEAILSEDFTYIDSWREGVSGRDRVLPALRTLFEMDPDFGIEIDTMDWREPHVLMTGRVNSRSFGMGRRAVWQVLVREGRVAQYQAWAEGGPPPMSRMLAPDHAMDMTDRAQERPAVK